MKSKFNLLVSYYGSFTGFPVKYFKFPGGELQPNIQLKEQAKVVWVEASIRDSDGLIMLALIKDILEKQNVEEIKLNLHYMPYARQDRVCNDGEAFGLKVIANLINSLNFDEVMVDDPHSDVTPALLENVVVQRQVDCFAATKFTDNVYEVEFFKDHLLISPDAGANKKTLAIAKHLGHDNFIRADKIRNVSTGVIEHTAVYGNVVDRDCLIVDDICDGGATFIALAKQLKFQDAKSVSLYVTHGIFSKGKQHLLDNGIDNIYCYHDWTEE